MNRRDFLRNAAIIAAGAIAADQLELLERLAPRRLYWPGADFGPQTHFVTLDQWDALLRDTYSDPSLLTAIYGMSPAESPFVRRLRT